MERSESPSVIGLESRARPLPHPHQGIRNMNLLITNTYIPLTVPETVLKPFNISTRLTLRIL